MDFQKIFSLTNAVISPVVSGGKSLGLLIAGNNKENFSFSTVDYELVDLLSKQISIAIENDSLAARVRKLETIDQLTGLFNNTYMQGRLDEEILRAIRFQRPCALILLSVDRFDEYRNAFGHLAAENALIRIGDTLKENIAKVDKLGRFEDHEFALISLERNKRQSIKLADEMRKKIESIFSQEEDTLKKLTVRGAVAENPLDGMVADELISKAKELLKKAKDKKGNEIYS